VVRGEGVEEREVDDGVVMVAEREVELMRQECSEVIGRFGIREKDLRGLGFSGNAYGFFLSLQRHSLDKERVVFGNRSLRGIEGLLRLGK
jgi:hypothetical protein